MNNENNELLNNDVETNVSEENIILAPPVELFEEAKEIAQNTYSDEKFPFALQYDSNQKEFLLSMLETIGAIVENDDGDGHVLATRMNMTQLAFIKLLDCVERVKTDKGINPFLAEEAVKLTPNKQEQQKDKALDDEVQVAVTNINPETLEVQTEIALNRTTDAELEAVATAETEQVGSNIAVTSVTATARSSCCPHPTNVSMETAATISDESYTSGYICCPGAEQWFKFVATKTGQYTICTTGNLDTVGTLYDCCGNQITKVDDYAPCGEINFRIICNLTEGNTYYVKVGIFGDDTGNYTLCVTARIFANYVNINKTTITLEKGVTYELPITPNYTYKGYNGAQRIPGLSVSINPSNANEQKIWWWEQYGSVLDCSYGWDDDGDRYIHVTATGIGTAKLYAQDWNESGKRDECIVNVDNILIYRTRNRERLGFYDSSNNNDTNPITAEDLTYGSKSTQTMISNGTRIAMSDLNNYNSISQRVTIIKNFFNSQINYDETFMEILSEMVDHFVDGTGTDYSNEALTSAVKSHSRTTSYVNSVVTLIKNYISKNKAALGNLAYDENLWTQPVKRASHPLVSAMNTEISNGAKELYLPSYGYNNGVPGLTLALDGFYGNKIKLKNFQNTGSTYSGDLEFTFYDHFGLDTPDLADTKYGSLTAGTFPGFKQWYILQHWSNLEGAVQPKPFVTNVSFSVPFSGTYE